MVKTPIYTIAAVLLCTSVLEGCASRTVARAYIGDGSWQSENVGIGSYLKGPEVSVLVRLSLHERRGPNARYAPPLAISLYFDTAVHGFEFNPRRVELLINGEVNAPSGIRVVHAGPQARSASWDCGPYRDIELTAKAIEVQHGTCVELYFAQLTAVPVEREMSFKLKGLSRAQQEVIVPTVSFYSGTARVWEFL